MRRIVNYTLLALLVTICEFAFAKYIAIGAAVPMLSFCYVILAAMNEKNKENSLIIGILVGALCDILGGHGFGTYAVVFGVTAWETATFCDSVLSSRFLFLLINTFVMTVFTECSYYLLHIIGIGTDAFLSGFSTIILPTALYNVGISAIFYLPMTKLFFERR